MGIVSAFAYQLAYKQLVEQDELLTIVISQSVCIESIGPDIIWIEGARSPLGLIQ